MIKVRERGVIKHLSKIRVKIWFIYSENSISVNESVTVWFIKEDPEKEQMAQSSITVSLMKEEVLYKGGELKGTKKR